MNETFRLENRLELLGPFQDQLDGKLLEAGFSQDLVEDLRLVVEELLVNTISYGYESGREGVIELVLSTPEPDQVRLQFHDDAREFNPLDAPDRDPDDDRIGGWGIPLLRALTDKVEYRRQGVNNVLTIERRERAPS